eukprot:Skav208509  [mRNA]  locus=scaffold1658:227826:228617:- [translate_table: standard]
MIQVLSVDIITNGKHGDLTSSWTRSFWYHAMAQKWVVAVAAGPPCNTWSRAREHDLSTPDDPCHRGPRVLRHVVCPWGIDSMGLGELRQVAFGNLLLGFAVVAMWMMVLHGGLGLLEHPADLGDDSVSIWKLPVLEMLIRMPSVQLLTVCQGYFGSESLKPTGLLAVRLPELQTFLAQWRLTQRAPQAPSTGRTSSGQYRTAVLKEYPPAFCAAMAHAVVSALQTLSWSTEVGEPPAEFVALCKGLVVTTCGTSIGVDTAGNG